MPVSFFMEQMIDDRAATRSFDVPPFSSEFSPSTGFTHPIFFLQADLDEVIFFRPAWP